MSRYIDADKLVAEFKRLKLGEHSLIETFFANGVYAVIEAFPTADVEEVRHGEWLENGANYKCSRCGNTESYYTDSYCRVCGARMDGGERGMNALKAHERHLARLAEQERQMERERIEKMTPEEREQYEKEQAERLKDVFDSLAFTASIVPQIYR